MNPNREFLLYISILCALAFVIGCGSEPTKPTGTKPTPPPSTEAAKDPASKTKAAAAPPRAGELETVGGMLLDGFEGPEHTVWAFDSADDEGVAEYVTEGATQGKKALRVTLREKGAKGKLHLRRDVELDLSQASAIVADITVPAEKLSAALALKSDPGDVYQEIKPVNLKAGFNKSVRFALDAEVWKNAKSKWEYSGPPVNLQGVKRVMLMLFTGEEKQGSFVVDNLRVEGEEIKKPQDAGSVYREWRPEIVLLNLPQKAVSQYEGVAIPLAFRASYRDIFDSSDINVGMRVTTPSGRSIDVRGFFAGLTRSPSLNNGVDETAATAPFWGPLQKPKKKNAGEGAKSGTDTKTDQGAVKPGADASKKKDAVAEKPKTENSANESQAVEAAPKEKPAQGIPIWLLRFTPQETGRYTYQIFVRNYAGETRTAEHSLVVAPPDASRLAPGRKGGNVRISRRDSRHLELQDGSPFYIFGQNVCWTQDWAPYLEKIRDYGGNTCRIWLCPWGLNLERKDEAGSFNLQEAERIDELMEKAEETGVRIIFCFTYHGATASDWHDSAYNAANGGPCARPQDFFSDWRAKRQFKRLLSYAAARWGSSPALLSWELINEMNLAKFDNAEDVSSWSREMAGHLHGADVHNHLVTTSTTNVQFEPGLWHDSRIDFISVHGYGTSVGDVVYRQVSPFQQISKPVILAEFGGGTEPGDDIPDKDGARMQASLWLTACSPGCGLAMPWWWDTYIEARNLYPVLAAAGRFVAGEDRRGRYQEWVRKSFPGGVEATGIMDSQGARIYVHHPGWTKMPETRGPRLLAAAVPLELSGIIDGEYRIEFWDAREGKVFATPDGTAKDGKLSVELPSRASEFGIKIDRKVRLRPELK